MENPIIIKFLFYLNIISVIILIPSFIGIIYLMYKGYRIGEAIKKKTYELGKDLNIKKVEDYNMFVDSIEVPNRKVYWNMLKAGYKLIEMNDSIDNKTKEQLKITMLSKGILLK